MISLATPARWRREPMHKAEVLSRLRDHADEIRAIGARSLYLFGSTARGEEQPDSDIDLFIDYDHDSDFSLIELIRIENLIRNLLREKVEVTTRDGLHPLIRDEAEASAEKIF
jgi:predicted nucleotidyltransferase